MEDVRSQVVAGIIYQIVCVIGKICTPQQLSDENDLRFGNGKHKAKSFIPCGALCCDCIVKVYKDLHQKMTVISITCSDDQKYKKIDDSHCDLD